MNNRYKNMLAGIVVFPLLGIATGSYADTFPYHTGLKKPTSEQKEAVKKMWKRVQTIKPNQLGLARINEVRKEKKLPELDDRYLAPMGQDVIGDGAPEAEYGMQEAVATLPSAVDNSALPAFPGIGSQGAQNSCAAWATTYYQMTHNSALIHGWHHDDMSTVFSPKWTYNIINRGRDNGAYAFDTYLLLEKNGAAVWSAFPYDDHEYLQWPTDPQVWRDAINHRTDSVLYIADLDTSTGLGQLKSLLNNGYAVTFATYVYSWQFTTVADDPSTSADDPFLGESSAYWVNGSSGGHMMTIIGYNDNIWIDINDNGLPDAGEKGALKIANSWGRDWGNDGFVWLAYDALREVTAVEDGPASFSRNAAAWDGMGYHLVVKEEYTPKVLAEVTLNHARRNQLHLSLGVTDGNHTAVWDPFVMNDIGSTDGTGGPYAFDGSTTAVDGTFYFDFTDIIPSHEGARWYVTIEDSHFFYPATLLSYRLIDVTHGDLAEVSNDVPQTVDYGTMQASVYYDYHEGDPSNQPPVAVMTADPATGSVPLEVHFDGSQSHDDDGEVVTYRWNFGDGQTATGSSVTHVYQSGGTFTAKLTAIDDGGKAGTATTRIVVTNLPPSAHFDATPTTGDTPLDVTFDPSDSHDEDGQIITYEWDFGDGTTMTKTTDETFTHTYTGSGDFTVALTVTDNGGMSDTAATTVSAEDPNTLARLLQRLLNLLFGM